ncbi:MAG: cytochrome c nitrite reductase small subunit [Myxococcales bacterium]|nr:cytochrome c nitrite reductase small subunit [Myxococcales bacterium]
MTDHETEDDSRRGGRWRRVGLLPLLLVAGVGTLAGLGFFTFGYGEGAAYLSNDPAACANCHVMRDHFDSWQRSGHGHVAVCNQCHLPPDFVGKWVTKADNGFFHSLAFTTGDFPEPIRIKPRNRRVTQKACLGCHDAMVNHMHPAQEDGDMLLCVGCHADVGHRGRDGAPTARNRGGM